MISIRTIATLLMTICLALGAATLSGCASASRAEIPQAVRHGFLTAPASTTAKEAAKGSIQSALIPGQTTPSREEELWVIARYDNANVKPNDNETPGTGSLLARLPDQQTPVPVPLKHTDVKADIAGYIATVNVTQQFHNPFNSKIEAIYVFPLPSNAAINEFVMTVGDRKIRGIIRERAQAEQIYQAAKSQGYVASLLVQDRPNIFTQSVANIEPGKQIDIDIKYFHTLVYEDGWYTWHFPMVVGPRFNPPESGATGIGAVPRGAYGASGQKTEIQYLHPTERSGHDISLAVHLTAGVIVNEFESVNHAIVSEAEDKTRYPAGRPIVTPPGSFLGDPNKASITIALDPSDSVPNKDFVLRYRVAGDRIKSGAIATRDATGGYFSLMLFPPESQSQLPRKPIELVYVLDCSGSMEGQPIAQARAAIRAALTKMRPDDTFQIIKFSNDAQLMSDRPLAASPANIRMAHDYLNAPYGGGGTMMIEGIRKALDAPPDQSRLRFVCFLTDGYIGNEAQILGEIHHRLGSSRIFSFGVGNSVNRYLLDHMAKMGRGAVAYLALNQKSEPVMDAFFDRISHPALTDLAIDFGGMNVTDVYPAALPDLFVGRPVIVTGRFTGNPPAQIRVTGRQNNQTLALAPTPLSLESNGSTAAALRPVWARAKIADLADRSTWDSATDLVPQIKSLALEHGLLSAYTAFIAVDATRQTHGSFGTQLAVPVPVPDGVPYNTTVSPR